MPLAEQQRGILPARERIHALSVLAKQGADFVRRRIEHHGIFGEVLVWMVIFSGLRLMWSHEFPIGWWIILGSISLYEMLKDKFVWPAQRYADTLAEKNKPAAKPLSENGDVSGTA